MSECHSLWHAHRHCLHHSKQHCWYSQADDFSHAIHKAHFKRHLEIKGRILPFAWVPVPLALPTPLIAALGALKVGVPFLQGCHTLTVWLRALHQAPIPAAHTQSLLQSQNADSSVMPLLLCMLLIREVTDLLHSLCYILQMHLCFQARMLISRTWLCTQTVRY